MKFQIVTITLAALLLSGCSITQTVTPITALAATPSGHEVCIIENAATRDTFLTTYQQELASRGYVVRVIPDRSPITSCPLTSTYTARWSWDFTIYMAIADIRVYSEGREVGRAFYDARHGGGRPDKWVNAEEKIRELVAELFPQI